MENLRTATRHAGNEVQMRRCGMVGVAIRWSRLLCRVAANALRGFLDGGDWQR